jgi:Ca2+-binding RTX toxin-like protein
LSAGDGGNDSIDGCSRCASDNNSFSIQTSGTGGDDTVTGSSGPDIVVGDNEGAGGGGNDDISTLSGGDIIDGGPGDDRCDGGTSMDTATNCESVMSVP